MNTTRQCRRARPLALLAGLALVLIDVAGGVAQATSTITVGNSEVEYTDDWDLMNSQDAFAIFQHPDDPFAAFMYAEFAERSRPHTDNAELIEDEVLAMFESDEMITGLTFVESGTLADGTLWQLHALRFDGIRSWLLVTGNTEIEPDVDVVSMLLMPDWNLVSAHVAVASGFTVDGELVPVARVEQEEVFKAGATYTMEQIQTAPRRAAPPAGAAP